MMVFVIPPETEKGRPLYGNGVFGNTKSKTKTIYKNMLIVYIITQLSMAWLKRLKNGNGQHIINMLKKDFMAEQR